MVTDIIGLGVKDHSVEGNGIDASDRDDAINIETYPVFGLFMPDAIASYEFDGVNYFVTANEGDARDEDARVEDLDLDPTAFPNAAELQLEENLGRLEVSTIDGDTDGDGDFDELYAYGARSFTIFDAEGNLIFDSGDDFEQITAELIPEFFNSTNDENGSFDSRSDAKGPEPEGVVIGEVDGRTFAFIGLERVGGIMVYDITNPAEASFVDYLNNRNFDVEAELADGSTNPAVGDLGPEGLTFISAEDSPTGEALLAVSNEVSGTTTLYEFDAPSETDGQVTFEIAAGEQISINGFGGIGLGARPTAETIAEVDTLQFSDAGFTAANLQLTQNGDDLEISFLGDESGTLVTLTDFALNQLDNLRQQTGGNVDLGNIIFGDETQFEDSYDVFNDDPTQSFLWNENSVTFLTDDDNEVHGLSGSDDVINALGGNDIVRGLSGDDTLRGGAGDDLLEGGLGDDLLTGGSGQDTFVLNSGEGVDTITDFELSVDQIMLGNLSADEVRLFETSTDTLVLAKDTNEALGVIAGVQGLDSSIFA